jgi:hypothetical protein
VSAPADAFAETAGVEILALTFPVPLEPAFALTDVEAAGVEALAETLVPLELELALACAGATGVEALALAEATGGAVCTVALVEAEAAGVLTLTFAVADGAGVVLADTDADTETGVDGPVRPSALAGAARDRLQTATATAIQIVRRKPGFRTMIVSFLVGCRCLQGAHFPPQRNPKPDASLSRPCHPIGELRVDKAAIDGDAGSTSGGAGSARRASASQP